MKFSNYLDKSQIETIIGESVVFGSEILHTALLIRELPILQSAFLKSIDNKISAGEFQKTMSPFIFESYTDAFKINVFFENYLKARLLQGGYIIHKIKNSKAYASLSKKQLNEPISLSELLSNDKESLNFSKEVVLDSSLTNITLPISTMFKVKYNEVIKLPNDILETVKYITNKRNEIHFLSDWEFAISTSFLDSLERLLSFVNSQIQIK
jgi:hypothetical protein